VVGVVTQINDAAIFCVSDGTRVPTEVHGCCARIDIGDCVLLRNYTICWGQDDVPYLRDVSGESKVDVLDVHQDWLGFEHGKIKNVDAGKLRRIQGSLRKDSNVIP
jgi:hypothetical protein